MDNNESEPRVCTLFSSENSNSIFDTITFTNVQQRPETEEPTPKNEDEVLEKIEESKPESELNNKPESSTDNLELPKATSLFSDSPEIPFPIGFQEVETCPTILPEVEVSQAISHSSLETSDNLSSASINTFGCEEWSYDAWIPSENTKNVIESRKTNIFGNNDVNYDSYLTKPGIVHHDEMVDRITTNISKLFGETEACKRVVITADNVTQDFKGILELIKLGYYRSAINLTKRILTLYGQGQGQAGQLSKNTPDTLQIWFTRIALLIKIKEYSIAESEILQFGDLDKPDLYYEYYGETYGSDRKGTFVPFHFRLLAAEIPQYNRKFFETLDKLYKILFIVEKILENLKGGFNEYGEKVETLTDDKLKKCLEIWKSRQLRVYYSLLNTTILIRDYQTSFNILSKLELLEDPSKISYIRSAIGRLFIQCGDLASAQKYFAKAAELRDDNEKDKIQSLIDSGFLAIAQNSYTEAYDFFEEALKIEPENHLIVNNMSVCLLYMGKVKQSLELMEKTVLQNKPQLLQENVILNLSTIYELENTDGTKKNNLLKLIGEYKGDGFNISSLKIPNVI